MAAGMINKPGSKYSHCEKDCDHRDCAELRRMASSPCDKCGDLIGYEIRFYRDESGSLVHARCIEYK